MARSEGSACVTLSLSSLAGSSSQGSAALPTRVRRITIEDLKALVATIQAYQQQTTGTYTAAPGTIAGSTGTQVQASQAQAAAQAQAQAAAQAQAQAAAQAQAQAATQTQTVAAAVPAMAPTTQTSDSAVAIPASQIAPRTKFDYWYKHIAQFKGAYLPDGPDMRPNCGPASVTMALRMIGLDIPGFNGQRSESVLDQARIIATGKNDTSTGTTDSELERVIEASGGRWSETRNFTEMLDWVRQGIPVIMSGNPSKAWNSRYPSDQVYPFDGGHWVTVSGYDQATGKYIVNDPLSQIGPIYVTPEELHSYNSSHGNLGIAVFR